ncbi:MAG: phosphoglycerate kinase [Patescibacteria group bacterium]|nr:phosphoglycerate kinase [Patescibacteria group bacterium]
MNLRSIKDEDVKNKKVFFRADLDVPLENGKIKDTTRLKAWLPTLEYLLKNQAHVFIAGHLGRPKPKLRFNNSELRIEEPEFSLRPVAEWLKNQLEIHSELKGVDIGGFKGWEITGNVSLLENLRFYKEEEANPSTSSGQAFSQKLASIADIYVNDAFSSSHRAHASIVGVAKLIPRFAGFRLLEEVDTLSRVLENPKRPLVMIIGGAKIETKLPLVEKMHGFSDYVLVGGEIAENDKVLLKVQHEKIKAKKSILLVADLTENKKDITEKTAENFLQVCQAAQTVVWNGPMGLIEEEEYQKGTNILAEGLGSLSSYRIVGGGDTLGFLKEKNILDKFSFVSTGGGAMLEFLAGEKLPGIEILKK